MKNTITNEKMLIFRANAIDYLKKSEDKISLFTVALNRAIEATEPHFKKYKATEQDDEVLLYGKDKDGYLIVDPNGNMKITPENQLELNKKKRELNETKIEIELAQFELETLPKGISLSNYDCFSPIVLPELTDELVDKLIKGTSSSQKV